VTVVEVSKVFLDIITRARGGREVDKLAGSMDDLGDSMEGAAKDAERLDKHITATKAAISGLAAEIRSTGNLDLFKDLRKQQAELRKFEGLKKILGDAGGDGAVGFAAQFSTRIGPLLARAPLSPPLLAAIAAATPAIGAAVAAAVLGGLAAGVVGAGIAAAIRDPQVQAAADATGKDLGMRLSQATKAFVPATIGGLQTIRDEITSMEGDLRAVFDKGAIYVAPLARALTGLVREALPGLANGLEEAAPVIAALEEGAQQVGQAIGAAMDSIGDGAAGAALFVSDLIAVTSSSLRMIGSAVGILSQGYAVLRGVLGGDKIGVVSELMQGKVAADGYQQQFDALVNSLRNGGSAASTAAAEIRSLAEIMDEVTNATTTAFNAETKFGAVMDEVTRKAANHGAGIDATTKKGRENRDMLTQLASQAIESAKAMEGVAGGQAIANKMMADAYNRFIAVAMSMHMSRAKADELARSLGLIPPHVDPKVSLEAAQAKAEADRIKRKLQQMERTYHATVSVGIVGANIGGLLSRLTSGTSGFGKAASGGPVTRGSYLVGEKGPEVVHMGSSGYVTPNHRLANTTSGGGASAADIARAVAGAVSGMTVVLDGQAVGRIQGRTADRYARGG
jgi:hypothetical protein